eukprot:366288-Chlamydomonas_euryale.AAC.1
MPGLAHSLRMHTHVGSLPHDESSLVCRRPKLVQVRLPPVRPRPALPCPALRLGGTRDWNNHRVWRCVSAGTAVGAIAGPGVASRREPRLGQLQGPRLRLGGTRAWGNHRARRYVSAGSAVGAPAGPSVGARSRSHLPTATWVLRPHLPTTT